jgi:hypothetical protein
VYAKRILFGLSDKKESEQKQKQKSDEQKYEKTVRALRLMSKNKNFVKQQS